MERRFLQRVFRGVKGESTRCTYFALNNSTGFINNDLLIAQAFHRIHQRRFDTLVTYRKERHGNSQ